MSRRHAALTACGAQVLVQDLGSCNGTFVDGEPVRDAAVVRGQRVRFGHVEFLLAGGEEEDAELASGLQTDGPVRKERLPKAAPLTPAQRRVFDLLVEGLAEKAIAKRLGASPHTVHNHVCAVYKAYRVHSRPELLASVLGGGRAAASSPAQRPGTAAGGTRTAASLKLFYRSDAERDDYLCVLKAFSVPCELSAGFLCVVGPPTPRTMAALTAAVGMGLTPNH